MRGNSACGKADLFLTGVSIIPSEKSDAGRAGAQGGEWRRQARADRRGLVSPRELYPAGGAGESWTLKGAGWTWSFIIKLMIIYGDHLRVSHSTRCFSHIISDAHT